MYKPEQILYDLQVKRFEVFEAQDSEDGDFDVVFDIAGKKLYAHKFMLCPISTTFKTMLSKRWTKPDEPVKIEGYTFEDFKEFLTFIYSGKCQLTEANIFAMVDIAEFYGIQAFKDVCEVYLSGILNLENVHQMVELACKYSLDGLKMNMNKCITNNFITFFKSDKFQSLQESTVKELVETNQETCYQEEFFEAIYKWAENRALENQNRDPTLNINEAIKDELSEILRFFKFERMDSIFFHEFVAKKSFLFSDDEWNDILWDRKTKLFVKVIDENGKIMKGEIQCDEVETVANVINHVKGQDCSEVNYNCFAWPTEEKIKLSTPSKLIINYKTRWYLVFNCYGVLAVKRNDGLIEADYLLAEMSAENGFEMSEKCKIEVFSCA